MTLIRVSAQSRSSAVAGAIAGVIRENGCAQIQAIGPQAVNQATKAIAIARGYLALENLDVVCTFSFAKVELGGHLRTALKMDVGPRQQTRAPNLESRPCSGLAPNEFGTPRCPE